MKTFSLICTLFISVCTFAQTYEGSIGSYPILLTMEGDYHDISYCYTSQLKQIPLYQDSDAKGMVLHTRSFEDKEQERFQLSKSATGYTGTWHKGEKSLTLVLTESTISMEDYIKKALTLKRLETQKIGEKELVWFEEKYSKKKVFRLGNGFNKAQRAYLNPILDRMQEEEALTSLRCNYSESTLTPILCNDQYLSFTISTEEYCGGAHPNYGVSNYNYDLRKLERIEKIESLYPDLNVFETIREKHQNDSSLIKECPYWEESTWRYYSFLIQEDGISFTPDVPHAMKVCAVPFFISYDDLNK